MYNSGELQAACLRNWHDHGGPEADPDVLADIGIIPWEEGQTAIAGVYRRREQQRLEDIYGADMADAHRATTDQSSELQ